MESNFNVTGSKRVYNMRMLCQGNLEEQLVAFGLLSLRLFLWIQFLITMTRRREKKGDALQLHRQNPKVDEVTRIRITKILEQFRASKDEG